MCGNRSANSLNSATPDTCGLCARSVSSADGSRRVNCACAPPPSGGSLTSRCCLHGGGRYGLKCPLVKGITQSLAVMALVRMNLDRTTLERDCVNRLDRHLAIGSVGCGVQDSERQAVRVYHKMALRSRFAAIRRVRPRELPPFGAATRAEATEARSESMRPASSSLVSSVS